MTRVRVGDVVHFFDRSCRGIVPSGIGPYPAIVTFSHGDGTLDLQVFPIESCAGGEHHRIELHDELPGEDGQPRRGDGTMASRWWRPVPPEIDHA